MGTTLGFLEVLDTATPISDPGYARIRLHAGVLEQSVNGSAWAPFGGGVPVLAATQVVFGGAAGALAQSPRFWWDTATNADGQLNLEKPIAAGTATVLQLHNTSATGTAVRQRFLVNGVDVGTIFMGNANGTSASGGISYGANTASGPWTLSSAEATSILAYPQDGDLAAGYFGSDPTAASTKGFLWIASPDVADPTGVPAHLADLPHMVPFRFSRTSGKLWAYYSGAWNSTSFGVSATAITALTGDGTATGPGSSVFTLANAGAGAATYGGGGNIVSSLTLDAKGRVTAVTTIATPSGGSGTVTSVTATAGGLLAVGGTPSVVPTVGIAAMAASTFIANNTGGSAVPTAVNAAGAWNILGVQPAANFPALTGAITTVAGALATTLAASAVGTANIAANAVTLAKLATQADQTVLGNVSGGAAAPIALSATQLQTLALASIGVNVVPSTDATFNLGSSAKQWSALWVATIAGTGALATISFIPGQGAQLDSNTTGSFSISHQGTNFRFTSDITGIKFFGGSAVPTGVAQQASGANLTNNVASGGTDDTIANYTDLAVYANDSAAIRNDIYQLSRKLKQINDGLRAYGLFT